MVISRSGMSIAALVLAGCLSSLAGESADVCRPDGDWDRVLELGRGGEASFAQLHKLAERDDTKPSTSLARVIVGLWDDQEGTFETQTPHTVCRPKVSQEALRRVVPGEVTARIASVKATVTPRGMVNSAKMTHSTGLPELDALALATAREALFCPPKTGDRYHEGTITLTFRLEVR
jgi:TonB family protein